MSELFPESHSGGGEHGSHGGGKKGKILGMPPWLLGASAAGLILLFIIIRRRAAGGGTASPASGTAASGSAPLAYDDPNTVDPNSATGETYAQEGYTTPSAVDSYLAGSAQPSSGPVGLSPQGLPPPSTNTQWGSLVADYLIGQGNDPTLVTNAVSAFTSGQALTQAQQAIINTALQQFGEPPQGIIPVSTSNTNATTPTTPPPDTSSTTTTPAQTPQGPSNPVPTVTGKTFGDAKATLSANGFNVGGGAVQKGYSDSTIITSQTPAAGTRIPYGGNYWNTGDTQPTVDLG